MSSFFTLPGSARKRKRTEASGDSTKTSSKKQPARKLRKPNASDDEISSDSEAETGRKREDDEDEDLEAEFAGETAAERRLRLAEQYLANVRDEVDAEGFDAAEIDRDLIAERLQSDVAEEKGRLYRHIADSFSFPTSTTTLFRSTSTTTGIALCAPHIYTISRSRYLTKWTLPSYPPPTTPSNLTPASKPTRALSVLTPHVGAPLCLAASSDGKFVVSGGSDHKIIVYSGEDLSVLHAFPQHRDSVLSLSFRRNTNQLFSSSADRTIKLFSLDELAYVETLFGHQDHIPGISSLSAERCVTVGARDRTARLWKIVDETQLIFRGGSSGTRKNPDGTIAERHEEGSMDCVAMIDEETFVTGSDNGSIALWSIHKKKPLHTISLAHGTVDPPVPEKSSAEANPPPEAPCPPQPRWITALAAIPYSNMVFSGSWDGSVRVWRVSKDKRKLERVGELGGVRGVVNGIQVCERGEGAEKAVVVVLGTGREIRLGRWLRVEGRDGGYVVVIKKKEDAVEEAEEEEEDAGESD